MSEELAKYQAPQPHMLSREQVELVKRTILRNATDDELALFVQQCNRTQLDPFARQIYGRKSKAWNSETEKYEDVLTIQVSIDGFRLIAERTGRYGGQLPTLWCGQDGQWVDVWLQDGPPAAAKAAIIRTDWQQPIVAIAKYSEYVQVKRDGKPNQMWARMPANQLAKCAESLAFRKGFPLELSGLYTTDEMGQAENVVEAAALPGPTAPAELPQPTNGKPSADPEVASKAFFARVLAEIPYYSHRNHAVNALKGMGFGKYEVEREGEMFAALQRHAAEKANEQAAEPRKTLNNELDQALDAAQGAMPL